MLADRAWAQRFIRSADLRVVACERMAWKDDLSKNTLGALVARLLAQPSRLDGQFQQLFLAGWSEFPTGDAWPLPTRRTAKSFEFNRQGRQGEMLFTTKHTKHTKSEKAWQRSFFSFGVLRVFRGKSPRIFLALLASLAVSFWTLQFPCRSLPQPTVGGRPLVY